MISGKNLKEMVAKIPDESKIYAYEGEHTGIVIRMPDGSIGFIRAIDNDKEDEQKEFPL